MNVPDSACMGRKGLNKNKTLTELKSFTKIRRLFIIIIIIIWVSTLYRIFDDKHFYFYILSLDDRQWMQ